MSPDLAFSTANTIALASWLLLAVLPRRRWAAEVVAGRIVPLLFAAAYTVIVAALFGGAEGGFSTLSGVAALFSNRWLLLAGWVHYLAFDLLVGTWEARDAAARGIPHVLLLPCLFLTFMFGPAGWMLYMAIRSARRLARPAAPPR
jgi:hypothetical protein